LGCCALALLLVALERPPFTVRIVGIRTTGQLATVAELDVLVTNNSGHALHPSFTVDEGGSFTTFWPSLGSSPTLGPGKHAVYHLRAPNFPSQAPIGGGFQVVAFTKTPATVSASAAYVPSTLHIGLTPDAINGTVPIGTQVTVVAQLYNQFDHRVDELDVPVYLGQIIYDQRGLILSEASVNGSPPGRTPVTAFTNAQGAATFNIVGTQATKDPVYFEANLVNSSELYPYGYSEILPIQFARP
jgi:hypothetical protein